MYVPIPPILFCFVLCRSDPFIVCPPYFNYCSCGYIVFIFICSLVVDNMYVLSLFCFEMRPVEDI